MTTEIKTCIELQIRRQPDRRIDGSGLSLARLTGKSQREIEAMPINDRCSMTIGDAFDVRLVNSQSTTTSGASDSARPAICMRGNLRQFDRLAASHSAGDFLIDGDAGDWLGAGLTGGRVIVTGSAGDRVGAAMTGDRIGMNGGRIEIAGDAGDHVGDRMRRGEIMVSGNAGNFLGAHLTAGTIIVAGRTDSNIGFAMRRGSIILGNEPSLTSGRFTKALPIDAEWLQLIGKRIPPYLNFGVVDLAKDPISMGSLTKPTSAHRKTELLPTTGGSSNIRDLIEKLIQDGGRSSRGDAATGGQGELIWPA